jgi:hypothetical protein
LRYAWLSTALSEMFTAELAAGAQVRTIPGENVARMKADLALTDTDSVGSATLARIRAHAGADVVLVGSYLALGDGPAARLRLDLRLQDARSGETIASITQTGTEADLFDLVSGAGRGLRERLDIGPLSPVEAGTLRASQPKDAEAARLYAEGIARLRNFDALTARSLLEQATQADPGTRPHKRLAALGAPPDTTREPPRPRQAYRRAADASREDRGCQGRFRGLPRWARAGRSSLPLDLSLTISICSASPAQMPPDGKDARATLAALRTLPRQRRRSAHQLTAAMASGRRSFRAGARRRPEAAAVRVTAFAVVRARLGNLRAARPRPAWPAIDTARAATSSTTRPMPRQRPPFIRLVSMGLPDEGDLSGAAWRRAAPGHPAPRRPGARRACSTGSATC